MKSVKKLWITSLVLGFILATFMFVLLQPRNNVVEQSVDTEQRASNHTPTDSVLSSKPKTEEPVVEEGLNPGESNEGQGNSELNASDFSIEEGKRAMSIPVNEIQNVSGYIRPGDYVDIVAIIPPIKGEVENAQILMQKIKVLATGNAIQNSTGESVSNNTYQLITLEVLPEEGAALAYASNTGYYTLMLRDKEDKGDSPHIHVTKENLNKGVIPN
ncbi:Flp pilus assembly protein CpaB [Salirhabdus sp. Marseille-P4669]|uniref:Flp pilus assembly protein CpaB n=1 Tax=Salirhabdus sp. Marseille-P4669 TaxID=2042310 RepID=UPI000C7BB431|nr:Flp pilus assembly protein CpaB [Salirhabdus sp. Marseille-P4669]